MLFYKVKQVGATIAIFEMKGDATRFVSYLKESFPCLDFSIEEIYIGRQDTVWKEFEWASADITHGEKVK